MIHPTAIVNPEAQIDKDVEIGPWCTIGPHVKIAAGTKLLSHVVIDGWTEIGKNNNFFPFSVIGAVPQDLKYKGEPTKVIIGNNNTIRESVTINLGTVQGGGMTKIGDNCLLMGYTHLGHDCIIGNNCIIANYGGFAGHVTLEDYVTIGGMTGISQFVRVGAYAYVGGQSGLEKDVPPYSIVMGARPCIIKGANIIGLKRRGFSTETVHGINEALKMWTRREFEKEHCLKEIESQYGEIQEVQKLLSFIRNSENGVVRQAE
jgi:UDP-N-acetylglucosamine acyltransferase